MRCVLHEEIIRAKYQNLFEVCAHSLQREGGGHLKLAAQNANKHYIHALLELILLWL